MALTAGTRLGHYNVSALIGEGGMGQVWQATDTQLNRQVALKILPDAFADDPDRLARFQREAQVLASLNHPNIGGIHGLEESDGVKALVLELVEGPTLARTAAATGEGLAQVLSMGAGDPLVLIGAPALMVAVALIACHAPARRSTRVDPLAALREE
jgi:hypothetical protein